MSRKQWKMRFSSRAAAAATLSAQSIAGRVRAMPTREPRNQPIFKSHHYLPPNKRLNDGTMKGALNPDEDRDRDFAQSFRPPCRQRQDQPAGSGPVRRPLQGLRLRNGQAWRSGMAGKRAADLRIRFPALDLASLRSRRKSVAPRRALGRLARNQRSHQDMETAKPGKRSSRCRPGFVLGSAPRRLKVSVAGGVRLSVHMPERRACATASARLV